jgi:hypothetical protein
MFARPVAQLEMRQEWLRELVATAVLSWAVVLLDL